MILSRRRNGSRSNQERQGQTLCFDFSRAEFPPVVALAISGMAPLRLSLVIRLLRYCYLYFSTIFTIRSKSSPTLFSGSNCSRHLNDPTPLL